jgi:hypothetical protein
MDECKKHLDKIKMIEDNSLSPFMTKIINTYCCVICNTNILNFPVYANTYIVDGLYLYGDGDYMSCPFCVKNGFNGGIIRSYFVKCAEIKPGTKSICYKNKLYFSDIYSHNDPKYCISMTF